MQYRLGLDIGTNSIGWCRLELNEDGKAISVLDAGVRIFSDGRVAKGDASLAVSRRLARQARRRRDRLIKRRKKLMEALVKYGLMPENEAGRKALESLDPYYLRSNGIQDMLGPYEIGRALFHLNQRRGFKSNRKVAGDDDAPKIRPAIERLKERMGDMTYGQYLYKRRQQGLHVRARKTGKGNNSNYDFYPERALVEDEFNRLWDAQAIHHPFMTKDAKAEIHNAIFYQRPLKPVEPGKCTFEKDEHRCPRSLPLAQRFALLQELNHLRLVSPTLEQRRLSKYERDLLLTQLLKKKKITFTSMRRSLGLPTDYTFSIEGEKRKDLKGDETGTLIGGKKGIGAKWLDLSFEEQTALVKLLLESEDEIDLIAELVTEWNFSENEAIKLARLDLPAGYARISEKALEKIVPELESDVITYDKALVKAGYDSHSLLNTNEILPRLPYYGIPLDRHVSFGTGNPADVLADQFGCIANPSVHIALNQIRRVVNELIKLHGHPAEIILEVARDLKNGLIAKKRINKIQAERQKQNDAYRKRLEELGLSGQGDGVLRLRLWEELHHDPAARRCPYTGETISIERLFSGGIEIEHILPFSRTLDDSIANKTLCTRQANRDKGEHTPYEAFGSNPAGYDWRGILARAAHLPQNKIWRFAENAMLDFEEDGDFLARQLTDTQYIAKLTREYLTVICPREKVWVTPGRLTYLLSRQWGMPRKNRNDHRHHAMDAIIIGVTDRGVLQNASRTHAHNEKKGLDRFLANLPAPWPSFRVDVLNALDDIIVSHRTDHGIQGKLHNETAYSITKENGNHVNAEHRVPVDKIQTVSQLLALKGYRLKCDLLQYISRLPWVKCRNVLLCVKDEKLAKAKNIIKEQLRVVDKDVEENAPSFFYRRGVRGVKICETIPLIPIRDANGVVYKGFKGDSNAYYEVYMAPDGKWEGEIVSTFDANQPGYRSKYDQMDGYLCVTKLFINDMLEIEHNGGKKIVSIVKLSENQIALCPHQEANGDKRTRDKKDSFRFIYKSSPAALQKAGARPIHVTPAGRILYLEVPSHAAARSGDIR